jgi:hypothetical protein
MALFCEIYTPGKEVKFSVGKAKLATVLRPAKGNELNIPYHSTLETRA